MSPPRSLLLAGLTALALCAPAGGAGPPSVSTAPWAFRAPRRPVPPAVKDKGWVRNPVDSFILAKLEEKGLTPSKRAGRLRLLRRVTFDLTGLPPTPGEQESFLRDRSPDAYDKLVDRLLASPAHGERWAQHWLDLVRYAETDGFKADGPRPDAHKYRDWVIRALNSDLPYDSFVRWQLAGDELGPGNPEALLATGYNRLWPDEYNAANLEQRRQEILDDTTDTTALAFLGLTFGCARCHDHKYDPITQKDYFRLQAFFAAMQPRDLPLAGPAGRKDYQRRLAEWEEASRDVREEIDRLLAPKVKAARAHALTKFRPEIQKGVRTDPAKRTPYQWVIALMAEKQMAGAEKEVPAKLPPAQKKRYQELRKRLAALPVKRPDPLPTAMAVTDVGPEAPPTYRLVGGDWRKPAKRLRPGFPAFLGGGKPDTSLPPGMRGTGSRSALARWLTRPDHPLTARVIVNRLWQHHFGVGIVATGNDFGAQGAPPTHPELLDWLAVELVESGWSLKHLHRLMVTSAAYCQDSAVVPEDPGHAKALRLDKDNTLLWHARRRRLEGEAIRDAMLALSGELSRRMYGRSARPKLPANLSKYAWKPDPKAEDRDRRSVYVLAKRNLRYPLFDAFDQPDLHNSCPRRLTTTTAPQALLLFNGELALERAERWAGGLRSRYGEDARALVEEAYRAAWGRPASAGEVRLGVKFLAEQAGRHGPGGSPAALVDFCHALLNTNEFLYVD